MAEFDEAWLLKDGFVAASTLGARLVLSTGALADDDAAVASAWAKIEQRQPLLWDLMISHAARCPLLLLGCDVRSGSLQDLVARLRPHRHFEPAGWLVAEAVDQDLRAVWKEFGIEIVDATDEAFVDQARSLMHRRVSTDHPPVYHKSRDTTSRPFKLLDYYEREDAAIFHGRSHDTKRLVDLVIANRLVVVTGSTGAGKTSLLNAGLLATIEALPPFRGIYVRCMEDPIGQITSSLSRLIGMELPRPKYEDPASHSEMWRLVDSTPTLPIIVVDQGEELFTRFEETVRNSVFVLLAHAVLNPTCRARFVIGIRDDYLAQLADFRDRLPDVLETCFYVGSLTRAGAVEALLQSFEAAGVTIEEGLADSIVDDVGMSGAISPQIQIVGDHLYRSRRGLDVTIADYRAAGGTRGILGRFLRDELVSLAHDGLQAEQVLKAMVTSVGTKDVLSVQEITDRARLDQNSVMSVVEHLVSISRLVRPVAGENSRRYELAHEYLTAEIWGWLSPEERELREAEEMIAKDLRAWKNVDSLRLGAERLEIYYALAAKIQIDEEIGALLLLSSVRHLRPHDRWVEEINRLDTGAQKGIAKQLLAYVASGPDNQRFEAAEAIASLDPQAIIEAIGSGDGGIRNSALFMVGGLGLRSGLSAVTDVVMRCGDTESRRLACLTMGEIGGTEAAAVLIAQSDDPEVEVAAAAVEGLGACLVNEAFETIWSALSSSRPVVRAAAERALGAAASTALVQFITDSASAEATEPVTSRGEFRALEKDLVIRMLHGLDAARNGGWELLAPLRPSIEARNITSRDFSSSWLVTALNAIHPPEKRRQVHVSCGKQGWVTADHVVGALAGSDEQAVSAALASSGKNVFPVLRELSASEDLRVRMTVLMTLSKIPADPHVEWKTYIRPSLLEQALHDDDPGVRYWACIAASTRGLPECVQFIRPLTTDKGIGSWYRGDVGKRVCDAANWALDVLRPESKVWRKGWQLGLVHNR